MKSLNNIRRSIQQAVQSPSLRGGLFYAALWGVFGVFSPFMNLELSRRGFSGLEIGTAGSVRAAVILVMSIIFSRIADRKSIRVRMLRWVLILTAGAVTLFSFPRTFLFLIIAIIFLAIWQSPVDSLANSILVRMAGRYHVDYGMMTFWGAVSYAITNLIGGFLWEKIGFSWIYIVAGGGYFLVSFVASVLEEPVKEEPQTTEITAEVQSSPQGKTFKPIVIFFLATYFVFSLAFFNAFGFTANILDMRGANEFVIGLVGTLVGVGGMVVRRGNRALVAKTSLPTAMILGILLGIIPILVFGWVQNVFILLLVSTLRGASWGMFSLCAIRFIDQQANVENASTLQSSLIMINTFSNIIASTLSGYLFDTNLQLIFMISTICALVALGILLIVRWMERKGAQQEKISLVTSA
ncbi:MAG: MFS transporter [Anaerolineae bacterium]|jgi:PPP family 3-phenylpropionic acid transporter|nr:MFS transporter [Anaerolineae bacterium]